MVKLGKIVDAAMPKWDRNSLRNKITGQEGVAVLIEVAVGEVPQGGRPQRQRLLGALAMMLHIPMCSMSRSLPEDLASTGPTRMSSGERLRFVLLRLVHG
jgi:hypothetical protein